MQPLVTVILAVYNGEKYLGEAIESALAQDYSPIEIAIVDDGSQDSTEAIAKSYGSQVRYLYQTNRGQPSAQNVGISGANGSYIAFLDGDDLYMPDKISLQVEFLEGAPQVDMVFSHVEQFFSPEEADELKKKWICPPEPSPGHLAASGLFRKECFEKVGQFNEEQRIGVFIEWYMRAQEAGLKHAVLPHLALRRRIHDNNMGVRSQDARLEYVKIVKAALKRRALNG